MQLLLIPYLALGELFMDSGHHHGGSAKPDKTAANEPPKGNDENRHNHGG